MFGLEKKFKSRKLTDYMFGEYWNKMIILRDESSDRISTDRMSKPCRVDRFDPQTNVKKAVIISDYGDISTGHLNCQGH